MAIKRKRSMDSFAVRTPDAQSPPLDCEMDISDSSNNSSNTSTAFNFNVSWGARKPGLEAGCRTRKRHRDNRPDERVIHETTIQKLFSAQRNHPHAEPILSTPTTPPHSSTPIFASSPVQKSTLHSFWKISAPPVQQPTQQHHAPRRSWNGPHCEDCETPLKRDLDGDMDMNMDLDGDGGSARSRFACHECGKEVCATCAVEWSERFCLLCAKTAAGMSSGRY